MWSGPPNDSQITFDVKTNDFVSVERILRQNNVSEDDVGTLKIALQDDTPPTSPGRFGRKVSAWISGMVRKACEGTWGIAVGAAGKLLAEAISRYYGLQ